MIHIFYHIFWSDTSFKPDLYFELYFPIQNFEKISLTRSSPTSSPMILPRAVNDEIYITNQRHKEALREAYESMEMVLHSLADQMPEDFYSIDLMSAYASLGRIIGEEVGEDLVNEIFSKFCMGK